MSKIRVWTSSGVWSEEIVGLDKIDLIKSAILQEYDPYYDEEYELAELEINGESFSSEYFDAEWYKDNIDLFWKKFEMNLKADVGLTLSEVKTLKVSLSTIKKMAAHPYLSAAYDAIIAAACVPTSVPANYCLMLKFD